LAGVCLFWVARSQPDIGTVRDSSAAWRKWVGKVYAFVIDLRDHHRRFSAGQRDRFRAEQIGLIFQQFNLLPFASVQDNILLPLRFAPERHNRLSDPKQEATRLCHDLGLPDGVMSSKAGNLSVGQQQRVAAARALIGMPPLIIADEPTSSLDASTQATFLELLFAQSRAHGTTLLMVSHDARLSSQFDRVIHMADIARTTRGAT
jgi:putative ABC transport system ATP-binding protein